MRMTSYWRYQHKGRK